MGDKFGSQNCQHLVEFMYSRTLEHVQGHGGTVQYHFQMASRLGMSVYRDNVIEQLRNHHVVTNEGFRVKEISNIYRDKSLGNGQLWKHALENICGRLAIDDIGSTCMVAWFGFCNKCLGVWGFLRSFVQGSHVYVKKQN
jgi:hypothetical protein